jgi:hypothetical protein
MTEEQVEILNFKYDVFDWVVSMHSFDEDGLTQKQYAKLLLKCLRIYRMSPEDQSKYMKTIKDSEARDDIENILQQIDEGLMKPFRWKKPDSRITIIGWADT